LKTPLSIVIIGTGNVAFHLATALHKSNHTILQVLGRNKMAAAELAKKVKAKSESDFKKVNTTADIYIIAVKDDAIEKVAAQLKLNNKILLHTSGTINTKALKASSKNYGVFYPLQTFSKNKKVNFSDVPICIEANNKTTASTLVALAQSISKKVYVINDTQRRNLHLAAVFACNFSNHLYAIAAQMLQKNKLSFDLLKPLIAETAEKIKEQTPAQAQTGPAVREDDKTINTHLKMLSKNKTLKKIYTLMSEEIIKQKRAGNKKADGKF